MLTFSQSEQKWNFFLFGDIISHFFLAIYAFPEAATKNAVTKIMLFSEIQAKNYPTTIDLSFNAIFKKSSDAFPILLSKLRISFTSYYAYVE